MEIKLNARFQAFIREQVEAGLYESPDEMVRDALRLLEREREDRLAKFESLRRDIGVGLAELDAGLGEPWDPEEIKAEGRKRRALRSRAK